MFVIMIFLLIFTSITYAETCEVSRTKDVLRRNLYIYLINPSSSPLTINQVKDLLTFYLSISPGLITVSCSSVGSYSNQPISSIVNNGGSAPDIIPICSDGTKYGECSNTRPKFCYGGNLIKKCDICGCQSGYSCNNDGNCNPASANITCFNNLDCGTSQLTGSYYCNNNSIKRNYLNYTCINPTTLSSSCTSSTNTITIDYCNANLNQTCIDGYASCQTVVSNLNQTCSDGTQYAQCSVTNPLYCANGTLLRKCSICGCLSGLSCNSSTQICFNTTTKDNIPPLVSITTPASGSKVNSSITISANASDNAGVVGVQFKLDGLNLGVEDTTVPYSILWDTTTTTNGVHLLTAFASDGSGNINTSAIVTVNITNILNQIPVAIINYTLALNHSVRFNASSSSDPDGFITNYSWVLGDGAKSNLTAVSHTYAGAGIYLVNLTVYDNLVATNTKSQFITVT